MKPLIVKPPQKIMDDFWLENVNDENFLIHKESADIISLNSMAGVFVDLIKSGATIKETVTLVCAQLGATSQQVKKDFDDFIELLNGYQEKSSPPPSTLDTFDSADFIPDPKQKPAHSAQYLINNQIFDINFPDTDSYQLIDAELSMMSTMEKRKTTINIDIKQGLNGYGIYVDNQIHMAFPTTNWIDAHIINVLLNAVCNKYTYGVTLHAAALANKQGEAIIFSAQSGSGKSTLATGLALDGYTYLGDDSIVLDLEKKEVIPFPTAANLKPGSWPLYEDKGSALTLSSLFKKESRPVKYAQIPLKPSALEHNFPVKAIVFPKYSSNSATHITPLTPSESFQEINNETSIYINPRIAKNVSHKLIDLIRSTPCYKLEFNTYNQAKQLLIPMF